MYLLIACAQAGTRLLWVDELITVGIARTGSLAAIWNALRLGADPNPPLTHGAVLLSTRLFGQSALAVRLPAIAAMLLAVGCVWVLLRRWVAPGFAAVGVLAFMATRGFDYAYEARSYAPLAGFTMAAAVCWMWAADRVGSENEVREGGRWRGAGRLAALAGMALCLALAVSSNYYGVMAWLPIAAGEVVLSVRRRRVFPATWAFMGLAALPLLVYLPLIRHNLAEFTPHAWNRPHVSMVTDSYLVLVEGVLWPVVIAGAVLWWRRARQTGAEATESGRAMRAHEMAALGVLLGYPVIGFALAVAKGAMISPRCVIPVCCGFGIAAGLVVARLARGPGWAAVLLCVAALWVVAREGACAVLLREQRVNFLALVRKVESAPAGPVYIADSAMALPLARYGDEELRQRLVFPIDFAAIHAWEADDSGEQNLWAGRDGVFPIAIVPYSGELAKERPGMVIARPGGWLDRKLEGDGLKLKDGTSGEQVRLLEGVGGVFTPMDHEETRLLAPVR